MGEKRELDAQVAAEVLGLETFWSKDDYFRKGMPHMAEFCVHVEYPAYYHPEHKVAYVVPRYSECPYAMWEIWQWAALCYSRWHSFYYWLQRVVSDRSGIAKCNTLVHEEIFRLVTPEDVCNAALMVVRKGTV